MASSFKPVVMENDGRVRILIHPMTKMPTKAWDVIKVHQVHKKVQRLPLKTPIAPHKLRFVCVSDTHSRTNQMEDLPDGDVLIHAGDFTNTGRWDEVKHFNEWLGSLPHKHKIVIAGNHELSFEDSKENSQRRLYLKTLKQPEEYLHFDDVRDMLTNCTYLEDSEVQVGGIRIYGSPWQPEYGGWAFNLRRGRDCLEKWDKIPEGIDILVTHGPPLGHGDLTRNMGLRAGCVELLHTVQHRVKPKYHIFGHIHGDTGITSDGKTKFINASTCTVRYKPSNPPIIFDLDLREGHTKDEMAVITAASFSTNRKQHEDSMDTDVSGMVTAASFSTNRKQHEESMDTDVSGMQQYADENLCKNEKAENFLNYCEMANMSDTLGNMDFGPSVSFEKKSE